MPASSSAATERSLPCADTRKSRPLPDGQGFFALRENGDVGERRRRLRPLRCGKFASVGEMHRGRAVGQMHRAIHIDTGTLRPNRVSFNSIDRHQIRTGGATA